jgi:5,10-methylene-tetrahydrofolate dehydrogenase/methenyl tetrahydrofolate cyclohydrolase
VQLPLPAGINEKTITNAVDARKDVDGCVPGPMGSACWCARTTQRERECV